MPRVHHMVLLKFKPTVPPSEVDYLFGRLKELQRLIDGIDYYSGGPYSSPEGFQQGYTHGFLMTFRDERSRDAYLPHPEHEKVKADLLARLDGACAFDFLEQ